MNTAFPTLLDHIYIWIFGIILPFLSGLQSSQLSGGIRFDQYLRKKLYLSNSLMLALAGSSVLILWGGKKRAFSSIGFQQPDWTNLTLLLILLSIFIGLYIVDLVVSLQKKSSSNDEKTWYEKSSFLPEKWKEIPAFLLLCICAGIFEEIIYRGFMVTYFIDSNGDESISWVAIFGPAFLFSLAHFYQGWMAVFKIFLFTLLLNFIFIQTKSIYPTMVIHFLVDLISGMTGLQQKANFNKHLHNR
jgi:membrane protease YdiL (CAAX protease family)